MPIIFRMAILSITLAAVIYLFKTGHSVVDKGQHEPGLVTTGGFKYVRHPLYLASMLFYLGLEISTHKDCPCSVGVIQHRINMVTRYY